MTKPRESLLTRYDGGGRARTLALVALLVGAALALSPRPAGAIVEGTPHANYADFSIFGNAVPTGNTLMQVSSCLPQVNSAMITGGTDADVAGIPAGATLEGMYLFWSGSMLPGVGTDNTADFTFADGFFVNDVVADTCFTVPAFGGFYYCRADITALGAAHAGANDWNGMYHVDDVIAQPGTISCPGPGCGGCSCAIGTSCQAMYAAWSLIVVWSHPAEPLFRDITVFDGFRHMDEDTMSGGIDMFSIGGFNVGDPNDAFLTFFGMEGDAQLGVPPQDMPPLLCPSCVDFMEVNGVLLSDSVNPPGNLYNSTLSVGVDIDTFPLAAAVNPGDTTLNIVTGAGDGIPHPPGDPSGGGESLFLGYVLVTLNRPAPNFGVSSSKLSNPSGDVVPGQTITYTIVVQNDGSDDAHNTIVSDPILPGMTYIPGSTTLDGGSVADVGGMSPLSVGPGMNIGLVTSTAPGDTRIIQFQARVNLTTPPGTVLTNVATLSSDETVQPFMVTVNNTVVGPNLGIPTKSFVDLDGGRLEPGDLIEYSITIPNPGTLPAFGLTFLDDLPQFLQLLAVSPPGGATDVSNLMGGVNGTGRVEISNIAVVAGGSATFTFTAQVADEAGFNAGGIASVDIHGTTLSNQGQYNAPFLMAPALTDDPGTAPSPDATTFTLFYSPVTATSAKAVTDLNGAPAEPGDTLRYTVTLTNTGNFIGTGSVVDDLPPAVTGFNLVSVPGGATAVFSPAPAGVNNTGSLSVTGITLAPGASVNVVFDVDIDAAAANGTIIQNVADLTVANFPAQNRTLTSPPVTVFAQPSLEDSSKTVADLNGAPVQPGDTLEWTLNVINSGNRDSTGVVVTDVVDVSLTNVVPLDGGSYNPGTRTITWNIGAVPASATVSLRFQADVVSPISDGTVIANQGVVASVELPNEPTDDPATPADDDPTLVTVVAIPDLTTTTKAVTDLNGGVVEPGDLLEYTIVVTNSGDGIASGVTVRDPIPANTTVTLVGQGGAVIAGDVRWGPASTMALAMVNPGASVTLTFTVQLATPLADGTIISNQAFADFTSSPAGEVPSDDPATPATDDPTEVVVVSTVDLSTSTKTAVDENGGPDLEPGDIVEFTITVVNTGNAPATAITVTDLLAPQFTLVQVLDGGSFDVPTSTATWSVAGPLNPGPGLVLRLRAQVVSPLPDGTVVCNQASIASAELVVPVQTDDPTTANNDDATCLTVTSRPDLADTTKIFLDLNGGAPGPGDSILFTITVPNTGSEDAVGVTITDAIDPNLTNVVPAAGGVFNAGTGQIVWNIASIPAGGQAVVTFTADVVNPVANGTVVSNQAVVDGPQLLAPVLSDNPLTPVPDDPTTFIVSSEPNLETTIKTVSDDNGGFVVPGDTLTYSITVINTGNSPASNVVVVDPLPGSLTNVVPGQGGVFDGATNSITWDATTTPALLTSVDTGIANAVILTFTADIAAGVANGAIIDNTAVLATPDATVGFLSDNDGVPPLGEPTSITVSFPELEVTKTVADDGEPNPGDTIIYTITVTNTGAAAVNGVTVTDPIDTGTLGTLVPGQGGTVSGLGVVTWSPATTPALAVLDPGEIVTLTLGATILPTVTNGTLVANQATASSEVPPVLSDDPATPSPNDPTLFNVVAIISLEESTKTVVDLNGPPLVPGDTVEYTLTVTNTGSSVAADVRVTDPLPTDLTNPMPGQGGVIFGNDVVWTHTTTPALTTIDPGASVVLTFTADVVVPTPDGTIIANQAIVSADDGGGTPYLTDDPATPAVNDPTTIPVVAAPNLSATTKTVLDLNGGLVQPGDVLEYRVLVENVGTDAATGVVVVDAIPAFTTYVVGTTLVNGTLVPDVGGTSPLVLGLTVSSPGSPPGTVQVGSAQAAEIRFRVRVGLGTPDGTLISNQALASGTGVTPQPSDDPSTPAIDDSTDVVVGSAPNLDNVFKTWMLAVDEDGDGIADVGDRVRYTVTVENSGNTAATSVVVTDALPTGDAGYWPGSLTLGGSALTDAADADPGTVVGNNITVALGDLAPGATATITYEALIVSGPTVANQATVDSVGTAPEPSDNPDTALNNDPTIIPVGNGKVPNLGLDKSVADLNGGSAEPGDAIQYRIDFGNTGTTSLVVTLTDDIPANMLWADMVNVPAGATFGFQPPPVGANAAGLLTVSDIVLDPGEAATLTFVVTVGDKVAAGTQICNIASATAPSLPTPVLSDQECFNVDTPVGTGTVVGRVFRDIGADDRVFAPGDVALDGYQVLLFNADGADADPVRTAVAAEDGTFSLPALPPGQYLIRGLTEMATEMVVVGPVLVAAGETLTRDLVVDPTGVIYRSNNAAPLESIRVFLYYDSDDPVAAGELVDATRLGVGQQGQLTDRRGYYYFDMEPGRRYRIDVGADTPQFQFPSLLIPPQDGTAIVGVSGEVVPADLPLAAGSPSTYFTRFDVMTLDDRPHNNHVPVDPLSSLVRVDKRVNRLKATVGEVLTYTITIVNASTHDFVAGDVPGENGGALLVDATPLAFKLVAGSTVLRIGRDGDRRPLEEPRLLSNLLSFGPFTMHPGETLTLRYQMVVGLAARPHVKYENRAHLEVDGNLVVSNVDVAEVLVLDDPVFDEGLLFGKVFCDQDGDGKQDKGETGIEGARVYFDTGWYAVTDSAGKYHIRALDPGLHLAKIDVDTLPPGAKLTTDEGRLLHVTRGLPNKVNWGARCAYEIVSEPVVTMKPEEPESKPVWEKPKSPFAVIEGNVNSGLLTVDGRDLPLLRTDVATGRGEEAPVFGAEPESYDLDDGRGPLAFNMRTRVPAGIRAADLAWSLRIFRDDGALLWERGGAGRAPDQILWDGESLAIGGVYTYQLLVSLPDGSAAYSPVGTFGLGASGSTPERVLLEMNEAGAPLFTAAKAGKGKKKKPGAATLPSKTLRDRLARALGKKGPGADEILVVEVHHDGSLTEDAAVALTEKRAEAIRGVLVELGASGDDILALGMGSGSPVVPDVTPGSRGRNRRVVVKAILEAAPTSMPVTARTRDPVVFVADENLDVDTTGLFRRVVDYPADGGPILVDATGGNGRRSVVYVPGKDEPKKARKPGLTEIPVEGDLGAGTLRVGDVTVSLPMLTTDLDVEASGITSTGAELSGAIRLRPRVPADVEVRRWSLEIRGEVGGDTLWRFSGGETMPPPESTEWTGTNDLAEFVAKPGTYVARFVVEGTDGTRGWSPPRPFIIAPAPVAGAVPDLKITGDLFGRDHRAKGKLVGALRRFAAAAKGLTGERWTVRVEEILPDDADHTARTKAAALALLRGQNLAAELARLGVPFDRVDVTEIAPPADVEELLSPLDDAYDSEPPDPGGDDLLAPLDDAYAPESKPAPKKAKAKAKATAKPPRKGKVLRPKIEVTITPVPAVVPTAEPFSRAPVARLDGSPSPVESDDSFSALIRATPGRPLVVDLITRDGHRVIQVVPLGRPRADKAPAGGSSRPPGSGGDIPSFSLFLAAAAPAAGDTDDDVFVAPGGLKGLLGAKKKPAAKPKPKKKPAAKKKPKKAAAPTDEAGVGDAAPTDDLDAFADETETPPLAPPGSWAPDAVGSPKEVKTIKPEVAAGYEGFGAVAVDSALDATGEAPESAPESAPASLPAVAAANLEVKLPPVDAVITADTLSLSGKTDPKNELTINGVKVTVRKDGTFNHVAKLKHGKSDLVIRAKDTEGNVGEIKWPVEVNTNQWFLLALADAAAGTVEASLDGETPHSRVNVGPVFLHGRAAVYFKGRIKGKYLFKEYFITGHLDTAKMRDHEDYFENIVDPNAYYEVYGDSSETVRDVNARDKLFIRIEADDSELVVGNFKTKIRGIDLLRYERTYYGASVDFKKSYGGAKGDLFTTEVKAFGSRDDKGVRHAHNLLRGTGGSVYFLRQDNLVEGGERLYIVVRDKDTGLMLSRRPLTRNIDYTIDYIAGMVVLKEPLSSIVDAAFLLDSPLAGLSALDGHPVFLEAEYQFEGNDDSGGIAWGAHGREKFLGETISIGGGYISESREGVRNYELYGGDVRINLGKKTRITFEAARSFAKDAFNFASDDGGLSYTAFAMEGIERSGESLKAELATDLGEMFKIARDFIKVHGYLQYATPGFSASGNALDAGTFRTGGLVSWHITPRHVVTGRFDRISADYQLGLPGDPAFELREVDSILGSFAYEFKGKRWGVRGEYSHYESDDSAAPEKLLRDALAARVSFKIIKSLELLVGQEVLLRATGASAIGPGTAGTAGFPAFGSGSVLPASGTNGTLLPGAISSPFDRYTTTLGVRWQLAKDLSLHTTGAVRWSGDTAATIGLRTKLGDGTNVYVNERFSRADGRTIATTIVGAENRFGAGKNSRAFAEYQLDAGVSGFQNRALAGVGHKFELVKGFVLSGSYEHAQLFGGPVGNISRDTVSAGFALNTFDFLKVSGRYELRYDNGDQVRSPGSVDRLQWVIRTSASLAITKDITVAGRFNWTRTDNLTPPDPDAGPRFTEAEHLEAGLGLAVRPRDWDWFALLVNYTALLRHRPMSLKEGMVDRSFAHVLQFIPVFDLPLGFQLVEKFAWKRIYENVGGLNRSTSDTFLWINRLNWHLTGRIDASVEYRFWRQLLAKELQHGLLLEASYLFGDYLRLGLGYNFTSLSEEVFLSEPDVVTSNNGGFFIRIVGKY